MERKGMLMSEPLWTELEKMDVLRERMGIGYEEARTALNLAQGDVIKALDDLENAQKRQKPDWDFKDEGRDMWDGVKSTMVNISNSTITLKRHENTIVSLSAPLGLALAYTIWRKPGLRMLALVGAVGAAINHFELEVSSKQEYPFNENPEGF